MGVMGRKLTGLEKGMELLTQRGGTLNIVTTSKIIGILTPEVLRNALDKLQGQMPFLNCRITQSGQDLYFTTDAARLPLQVIQQSDVELERVIEQELNQTIDSSQCLMRVTAVMDQSDGNVRYVVTSTHHGVTDGKSSIAIHENLFGLCQAIQSDSLNRYSEKEFSSEDLFYVEHFMPKQYFTLLGVFKKNIRLIRDLAQTIAFKPQTLDAECSNTPGDLEQCQCGLSQRVLSPELTQQLVSHCHQYQVTVNSAICAAMLMSVAHHIRNSKEKINTSCRNGIDFRRLLKPEIKPEKMGLFASSVVSFHTVEPDQDFWKLAEDITQKIKQKLAQEDAFFNIQIPEKVFEIIASKPETIVNTIDVTNLGKVTIVDDYGRFKLAEISFVVSNRILARSFLVAVSTFNHKMVLNFATSEPSVSRLTREMLADNMLVCLKSSCSTLSRRGMSGEAA